MYDTEDEDFDDSVDKYVSKADCSDTNSTFDFAQVDLDVTDVIQEVKQKIRRRKKHLQCQQCDYKCTLNNTLKKHINTMHGATRMW